MRLHSVEVLPRGVFGWGSGELVFGRDVTSLHALNGSGKTPVVLAIVYCLGYPVTFREDIAAKCQAVRLIIDINGQAFSIERPIDKEFFVTLVEGDGTCHEFNNEKDYSTYIFNVCGLTVPTLVSYQATATQPYMSTTLPIFYLDQDYGYSSLYSSPNKFIKDQFVETVRFIFGFGPRNSYDQKKERLKLKDALESLDQKIVIQQKLVEDLKREVAEYVDYNELNRQIDTIKEQLSRLESTAVEKDDAELYLSELYSEKARGIQKTAREIESLRDRVNGISRIKNDILAETDTLNLNEEARRIFASFEEICSSNKCCLFEKTTQAYAKNLLYLKDQIKDLERNAEYATQRMEFLTDLLSQQKHELQSLSEGLSKHRDQSKVAGLVEAVRRLTQELIEKEKALAKIDSLNNQKEIYSNLETDRAKVQGRIELIGSGGETDVAFSRFKVQLKEQIVRWLDILKTKNVSRNITIENNLDIRFGGEPLDVIKGSTKIRIVLAIHAALFQMYLGEERRSFRFLILDTPKQHEIHTDDLLHYIGELKNLIEKCNAQVILSSTDFRYSCADSDMEWYPSFPGPEQKMYLGVTNDIALSNEESDNPDGDAE